MRDVKDFPFLLKMVTVLPNPLSAVRLSSGISLVCHLQKEENKDDESRVTGEYSVPVHVFHLCTKS